jgi:glycosyltransferase involved in cell wall biosynthesis
VPAARYYRRRSMLAHPIRVLHVIGGTGRGGAETWLVHLLRHTDRKAVAMDFFLCGEQGPGACEPEILGENARIYRSPGHRNVPLQLFRLWRLQQRNGPYQVVHAHVDCYGGVVVLLAKLLGVPGRIVNVHTDVRAMEAASAPMRRLYLRLMQSLSSWFATGGLGVSAIATSSFFGDGWRSDSRWHVREVCVDLSPFRRIPDRRAVRAELGIPPDAIVFGHVGRFKKEKNHEFLVKVAEIVADREPRAWFVLLGDGLVSGPVEEMVRSLGLRGRFILLPSREDVATLLSGAFDCFLFPSLYEGLGLALVEAQAAGLRCFASTAIPPEAIVVADLVKQIPLSAGAQHWAETILRSAGEPAPITQAEALAAVEEVFNMESHAAQMTEFYRAAAS